DLLVLGVSIQGTPVQRLKDEAADGSSCTGCGGQEVRALPKPLDGRRAHVTPGSGAQPFAAARAAGGQHLAAPHGLEAGAKSVTALAHQRAGLVGPLHELNLRMPSRAAYTEVRQGRQSARFSGVAEG